MTAAYIDFSRFAELKMDARAGEGAADRAVAQEFEALLAQIMLKAARDTVPEDGLFASNAQQMYQDMFDKQAALMMAEQGALGIQDVMVRQLAGEGGLPLPVGERQMAPLSREAPVAPGYLRRLPADVAAAIAQVSSGATQRVAQAAAELGAIEGDALPASREEFLAVIAPLAQQAGERLGVEPRAIMAQAVLETGWGQYPIRQQDGSSAFNAFGIKATPGWRGDRADVVTTEYVGGKALRVVQSFRAYHSLAEGFEDYVRFLESNPRYGEALRSGEDGQQFAQELQRAGYATDPDYASKVTSIMGRLGSMDALASLMPQTTGG